MILKRLALAALLALTISPIAAQAQEEGGSLGIRLVDAPEDRRDDPRASTYIVDHLAQGATITRHIELSATGSEPLQAELYVGAASLEDGEFRFGEGRTGNDLTEWTTLDPPSVTVTPGTPVQSTVTIAVPSNADDGERYAVIWAELPGSGGSANVVNRVGVRIYLSVGEGEEPVTDFTIDTLTARRDEDGTPIVETTVTNTGGRAIDISGSLQLANGPGSLTAGPFNVEVGTTLGLGQSAPAFVRLDPSLPDGPWDAVVTIESGRVKKEAKATLTFPSEPGESEEPVPAVETEAERQRKVLIPIAAGAAAVAGGAAAFFLIGRRRAAQAAAKGAKKVLSR